MVLTLGFGADQRPAAWSQPYSATRRRLRRADVRNLGLAVPNFWVATLVLILPSIWWNCAAHQRVPRLLRSLTTWQMLPPAAVLSISSWRARASDVSSLSSAAAGLREPPARRD
jgi:hypothetical protein